MRPFDDDMDVQDARDEAAIAGQAVTTDDAALVEVLADLHSMVTTPAPAPSAALAELLAHGATADSADEGRPARSATVIELAPRRRRAVRYVVGGVAAAALALGGSAAAAAVQDGVPVAQLPAAITERVGAIVTDALEAVGVRHRARGPSDQVLTDPGRSGEAPGPSDAPGQSGRVPGTSEQPGRGASDAPGQSGQAPGTSEQPGRGVSDAPGQSGQAPGVSDAPGQSGEGQGASQSAPGHSGEAPGTSPQPGQGTGEADLAPGTQDRGAAPSPGDQGGEPGQSKG